MTLEDLKKEYDKLQLKYGAKELDSIYNGGVLIPIYRNYLLNDVQSFVCLLYNGNEYNEECFNE